MLQMPGVMPGHGIEGVPIHYRLCTRRVGQLRLLIWVSKDSECLEICLGWSREGSASPQFLHRKDGAAQSADPDEFALNSWRSVWPWREEHPPAPGSLHRKGGVSQVASPWRQVLQMPGYLPRCEVKKALLHLDLCTGRVGVTQAAGPGKCALGMPEVLPGVGVERASLHHCLRRRGWDTQQWHNQTNSRLPSWPCLEVLQLRTKYSSSALLLPQTCNGEGIILVPTAEVLRDTFLHTCIKSNNVIGYNCKMLIVDISRWWNYITLIFSLYFVFSIISLLSPCKKKIKCVFYWGKLL